MMSFDHTLSPGGCVRDWTVRSTIIAGRIRTSEGASPVIAFSANWLYAWNRRKVRVYFDSGDPNGSATICALQAANGHKPGDILGTASKITGTGQWADEWRVLDRGGQRFGG